MRFVFLRLVAILSMFGVGFTAISVRASNATNYVEGEVLITFKDSVTLQAARQALSAHGLGLTKHFKSISQQAGRHIGLVRSKNQTTAQLMAALQHEPAVQVVEPSFLRHPFGATPNDNLFPQLWGLRNTGQSVNGSTGTSGADIKFTEAWGLARPSTNQVVVAVIDSGVDYTHPDLGVNLVAINASWGGGDFSSTMRSGIQACGDVGIVFCAAAGNASSNNDVTPEYPGNYRLPNMLVVAATDMNDNLAGFSDYGPSTVDLGAPGVNTLSTVPPGDAPTIGLVADDSATFSANPLTYSLASTGISAPVYDCGFGYPSDFPAAVNGNIALISRGTLYFSEKVSNAIAAGARAAIIYNNASGNFSGTLGSASNWIPAVSVSQADGATLKAALPANATVVSTNSPYEYLQGTSMATPHVSGAVAFAAMNFPDETVLQRVQRIRAGVDVIPGLQGKVQTGGRLNLQKVVDSDGNGLPDWWEQQYFGTLTGTDPNADPDQDGANNRAEWLAGTNPLQTSSAFRILSVQRTNQDVRITWNTVGGHNYTLQNAPGLGGGATNFTDLSAISVDGTNEGTTNFLHLGAGTNRALFYRVRQ